MHPNIFVLVIGTFRCWYDIRPHQMIDGILEKGLIVTFFPSLFNMVVDLGFYRFFS